MKIRNGFVSNSSSASFVIRWKSYDTETRTIREIIADILYPYSGFGLDKEAIASTCKNQLKEIDIITAGTRLVKDIEEGKYLETVSFTAMYNDHNDFDDLIIGFFFALIVGQIENKIEIIEQCIEQCIEEEN